MKICNYDDEIIIYTFFRKKLKEEYYSDRKDFLKKYSLRALESEMEKRKNPISRITEETISPQSLDYKKIKEEALNVFKKLRKRKEVENGDISRVFKVAMDSLIGGDFLAYAKDKGPKFEELNKEKDLKQRYKELIQELLNSYHSKNFEVELTDRRRYSWDQLYQEFLSFLSTEEIQKEVNDRKRNREINHGRYKNNKPDPKVPRIEENPDYTIIYNQALTVLEQVESKGEYEPTAPDDIFHAVMNTIFKDDFFAYKDYLFGEKLEKMFDGKMKD